ncbi:MAG: hypothetical protein WAJ87_12275 [Bryobacteraceae bacterium]
MAKNRSLRQAPELRGFSPPTIVTLSPDDPPVLTALTAGHVTISTATADVTVSAGPLPLGTVI